MIQILLSQNMVGPLAGKTNPVASLQPKLIWRADVETIGTTTCVVAEEQYTGYVMVLCGLTLEDLTNFSDIFSRRFFLEATAICKHAKRYDNQILEKQLKRLFDKQCYQIDTEWLNQGKLTPIFQKLEHCAETGSKKLPTCDTSAFQFGFYMNTRRPEANDDGPSQTAVEALRNLCLACIEKNLYKEQRPKKAVIDMQGNIVRVDFSK